MKRIDAEALAKALETRAKEDIDACNIGGISIAVAQSGELLYKNNFGKINIRKG